MILYSYVGSGLISKKPRGSVAKPHGRRGILKSASSDQRLVSRIYTNRHATDVVGSRIHDSSLIN